MKSHVYVISSVFLWGISQFLVDHLVLVFSPSLFILVRFFCSGCLLLLIKDKKHIQFSFKYFITGALGAFGYYILVAYALTISSVAFTAIMGGVLPVIAVTLDLLLVKKKPKGMQIFGVILSLLGICAFSYEGDVTGNLLAGVLMVLANVSWVCYGYLKTKWNMGESNRELSYEFLATAFISLFCLPTFKLYHGITLHYILELTAVVLLATILPYQLYVKGCTKISMSTASMYLNLLPVTSLLPVIFIGTLDLKANQVIGILLLILSACVDKFQFPIIKIHKKVSV